MGFVEGSLAIAAERDPARLLATTAEVARETCGALRAVAILFENVNAVAVPKGSTAGFDPPPTLALAPPPPLADDVWRKRLALQQADVAPERLGLPSTGPRIGRVLAVPIASASRTHGCLAVLDKAVGGDFTPEDERLARALGGHAAIAYEHALFGRMARATESLYRTLVEQVPGVIYYRPLDTPGMASFVSPQSRTLFGFDPEELLADPSLWRKRVHPADQERVAAQQGLFRPAQVNKPIRSEYRLLHKDGRTVWVHNYALAVRDDEGRARFVMGILFDVTEAKALEEQLRLAQKMEAIGKLAGGVAHDFNNLLSVILGYGAMVVAALPPGEATRRDVEEMVRAGERARDLTRQLLSFSRHQIIEPKVIDLGETVLGMEQMMRRLLGEDVELVLETAPSLRKVLADPSRIEQVILNLVVNARDALPRGGRISLQVSNEDIDEAFVEQHLGAIPGPYVRLSVSDNGVGMDRATLARIFEPFFTTKQPGQGTGLGLAMVFGIVQQSGGTIWAYSEPGHGTTMKVYLPETRVVGAAREPVLAPPTAVTGSETILLAEDDEHIRRLVRRILERQHYKVLEGKDGKDALEVAARYHGPIHLLLTDVVMPRMSGRELAEALVVARPGIKVIYMSGYTDDAVLRHGIVHERVTILQKPFTTTQIAERVRAKLDEG